MNNYFTYIDYIYKSIYLYLYYTMMYYILMCIIFYIYITNVCICICIKIAYFMYIIAQLRKEIGGNFFFFLQSDL